MHQKYLTLNLINCMSQMNKQGQKEFIIIGYFGVRAKAQVCRHLCEYLQIPYKDRVFTLQQWQDFQRNQAKNWIIKGLPFLIDQNFIITGQHAINQYIIRKANKQILLGKSIKDRIKIDMFKNKHDVKDNIIALLCRNHQQLSNPNNIPQQSLQYYWKEIIQPKMQEHQKNCKADDWYFGYLTLVDFIIYQTMNYILWLFPNLIQTFPKLVTLRNRLFCLDKIYNYQNSSRAIKVFNPLFIYCDLERYVADVKLNGSLIK